MIWNLILNQGWYFFTDWNLELLSIYYALAFTVSVIGLVYEKDDVEWSRITRLLGSTVHVLFAVTGATAMLVTVVAFSLLNPAFSFWNATVHFSTTLSLLWEMYMNGMYVRFDFYAYDVSWAGLYLIFIWPVVATGIKQTWPYNFLDVSTWTCFLWYSALLLVHFLFFSLWYSFSRFKLFMVLRREAKNNSSMTGADNGLAFITTGQSSGNGSAGGNGGGATFNERLIGTQNMTSNHH